MTYFSPNQVKYWRKYDDPEPGANRIFVSATVNQTRLENMLPDSHYLIEVRAFNGAGLGPPGEHCEMFTKRPREWNLVSSLMGYLNTMIITDVAITYNLFCLQHHQTLPECGVTLPGQENGCMFGGIISSMTGLATFPSHCTTRCVWKALNWLPDPTVFIFHWIRPEGMERSSLWHFGSRSCSERRATSTGKFTSLAGTSWTSPCLRSEIMSWWFGAVMKEEMGQSGRFGFRVSLIEGNDWFSIFSYPLGPVPSCCFCSLR